MGPVPVQPVSAGALPRCRPGADTLAGILVGRRTLAEASREAYVLQYGEIFKITAIVCVVGALLGLLISGRHEHADEPASASGPDDAPATR